MEERRDDGTRNGRHVVTCGCHTSSYDAGSGVIAWFGDAATLNWRTYAGIDAGSAVGNSNRTNFVDENVWLIARGTANLRLNFLERLDVFDSVSLFADDTYRYLTDSEISFSYLTA